MQLLPPIVLVEDDANDALFVREALEAAQIANPLIECKSAQEARRALLDASISPVLFILDVHLSGNETGIDLLRWLRQQPQPLGSTPAMMLTGSEHPEHSAESSRLGTTAFLRKPATEQTLTDAVRSLGFQVITSLVSGRMAFRIERPSNAPRSGH
jgi:CheY-like chemotaxis protein